MPLANKMSVGCGCCETECCCDDKPSTGELTFSGVADNVCTDCGDFNSTVFLLSLASAEQNGVLLCPRYAKTSDLICANITELEVAYGCINPGSIDTFQVQVTQDSGGNPQEAVFAPLVDPPSDCETEVADIDVSGGVGFICDWSNATATWTPST